MNILFAGKEHRFKYLANWFGSMGHNAFLTDWDIGVTDIDNMKIDFCFLWSGNRKHQQKIVKSCMTRKLPHMYAELGWFPQNDYIYVDQGGPNGLSRLHKDDLSWVDDQDYENLSIFREDYKKGLKTTDEGYILVPLQLSWDVAIKKWAPCKTVAETVDLARKTFPNDKLIFRRHPKDKNEYPELEIDWSEGSRGTKEEMIMAASHVWGMNSTMLMESALMQKPTTCVGKNFLSIGDNQEQALAALVAYQLPLKECDFSPWMRKGRALACVRDVMKIAPKRALMQRLPQEKSTRLADSAVITTKKNTTKPMNKHANETELKKKSTGHHITEISRLLKLIGKLDCRSYLEVGAMYGDTFLSIGSTMDKAVAIDAPGFARGVELSAGVLNRRVEDLKSKLGVNAHFIKGDSKSRAVIKKAQEMGPYDVVFIDGDASYEGVLADWHNYEPMAKKLVIFYNIINKENDTPETKTEVYMLWENIKRTESTIEFAETWSRDKKGIGVVVL